MGLAEIVDSFPGSESIYVANASATRNAESVLVSRIGVSISPSSASRVAPTSLP